MSFSVEQILDECRGDSPSIYIEKEASVSSDILNTDEIENMVSLLKEASIPETLATPSLEQNFYEKVAEAAILNSALQTFSNEGEKFAAFREKALNAGYNQKDIDALIEKKAAAFTKKNLLTGLGVAGLATAGTGAGYFKGKSDESKKTRAVGRAAFTVGRKYEYRRMRDLALQRRKMLLAQRAKLKQYLASRTQPTKDTTK